MTTTLAGLVAMRLSHELAGPIGAISTGVGMLGSGDDGEIRELIVDSTASLVATLRLHRFVLAPPEIEDAAHSGHELLAAWVASREALSLDWQVKDGALTPPRAALLLGLAMCAAEATLHGGALVVGADKVTITARQIMLDPDIASALLGAPVVKPRAALAGLMHAAAREAGAELGVADETGVLRLRIYQGSALPR